MTEEPSFSSTLRRIYWTRHALRLLYVLCSAWLLVAGFLSIQSRYATAFTGINSIGGAVQSLFGSLLPVIAVPGGVVVVLFATAVTIRARDVARRDPVRRFSGQQRHEGMKRADGQCELESGLGRRCSRSAEHGDPYYPWSKGGSTSLRNFVAACSRCNRAKGARIPSPGQHARLERRRRSYVDSDKLVDVGERRNLKAA